MPFGVKLIFLSRMILQKAPPTGLSSRHKFQDHEGVITNFVFFQDNVHIVSSSEDGTMCKWNCETGLLVGEPWEGKTPVSALALSPDGKTIACGRSDGTVERWDTNGQMMKMFGWDIVTWCGRSHGLPMEVILRVVPMMQQSSFEMQKADNSQYARSRPGRESCLVLHIHLRVTELHQAAWRRSVSGTATLVGVLSARLEADQWEYRALPRWLLQLSVAWSLDGSKLYSVTGQWERVSDSTSGRLLQYFADDRWLHSTAVSPTQNVRASVGGGSAVLWDTESQHGYKVNRSNFLDRVSFSPDSDGTWHVLDTTHAVDS